MTGKDIHIIPNSKIDKEAWDALVRKTSQALIYNESWYLDIVAPGWELLHICGVGKMALPVKRRMGIHILATPMYVQRLSFIFDNQYDEVYQDELWKVLKNYGIVDVNIDIVLNEEGQKRKNFFIDLRQPHSQIFASYDRNRKDKLKKAEKYSLFIEENISIPEHIAFFRSIYGPTTGYGKIQYTLLSNLLEAAKQRQALILKGVKDSHGETVHSVALIKDNKRYYYLVAAPTSIGQKMAAPSFFINEMLKRWSGQDMIFDFEGSDMPNVATFYKGFGPQEEFYYAYTANNLSFPFSGLYNYRKKLKHLLYTCKK